MKPADCLRKIAAGQTRLGAEMYVRHGADLLDECERDLAAWLNLMIGEISKDHPDREAWEQSCESLERATVATLAKLRGEA